MKFCSKLLKEINFEPEYLSPCCQTRNVKIPAFPYAGGEIDLNAYARHIEKILEGIQADAEDCRNCPELVETDALPGSNGQFRAVSINMHRYFCNCKCTYCSLWKHPQKGPGYEVLPGLKSLYEQNALQGNCFVSWGGGEPSILPQFDETSSWVMGKGFFQQIHTNALRFSPAIAEILSENKGRISVSLDNILSGFVTCTYFSLLFILPPRFLSLEINF